MSTQGSQGLETEIDVIYDLSVLRHIETDRCLYCQDKLSEEYLQLLKFVRTNNGIVEMNSGIKSVLRVKWNDEDTGTNTKFFFVPQKGCACVT